MRMGASSSNLLRGGVGGRSVREGTKSVNS